MLPKRVKGAATAALFPEKSGSFVARNAPFVATNTALLARNTSFIASFDLLVRSNRRFARKTLHSWPGTLYS